MGLKGDIIKSPCFQGNLFLLPSSAEYFPIRRMAITLAYCVNLDATVTVVTLQSSWAARPVMQVLKLFGEGQKEGVGGSSSRIVV